MSKTPTQQVVEWAIEGGWKKEALERPNGYYEVDFITRPQGDTWGVWFYYTKLDSRKLPVRMSEELLMAEIVIDPTFWQAIGKVKGWGSGCNICLKDLSSYAKGFADECKNPREHLTKFHNYPWQIKMHQFIDHLCDGDDINTALSKTLKE